MTRPRLKALEVLDGFKLRLTFVNGAIYCVDFRQSLNDCTQLAPLRDSEAFSKALVVPGEGWTVEWPELDIQIGADTLWLDAQAQNAPNEGTRLFAGWRARYGLSLKQAADALGLTVRTVSAYSSGKRPIPKAVQLACIGWETLHRKQVPESPAASNSTRNLPDLPLESSCSERYNGAIHPRLKRSCHVLSNH
jgi:hypothetical protein